MICFHFFFAAITTAIITISDENDNAPSFVGGPFTAAALETLPRGATVIELPATDADVDFNDVVQFEITAGNSNNHFAIVSDPVTLIGIVQINEVTKLIKIVIEIMNVLEMN